MPPPMHMVAIALDEPVLLRIDAALPAIRAPDAPKGWPIDIAPPSILIRLESIPNSDITARLCEEKASLSSITSTESNSHPVLFSSFLVADTGPMPISSGLHPVTDPDIIRASGFRALAVSYTHLRAHET